MKRMRPSVGPCPSFFSHELGINDHDTVLYEMGIKEKEHEVHFLEVVKDAAWLPLFEKIFSWGPESSLNDVDLQARLPVDASDQYCKNFKSSSGESSPAISPGPDPDIMDII
jgi:hypothetical protein